MYIKTYEKFSHIEEIVLGVDLDGVLNAFTESYNKIYKKYFPDYDIVHHEDISDWNYFTKYNYEGEDPYTWFNEHKAEAWLISEPYTGARTVMKNTYEWSHKKGIMLRIVTNQPDENSKNEAVNWLMKFGFKYDDIAFVKRSKQKWDNADIMIDDSPKVLESKPDDKVSIKVMYPYNEGVDADFGIKDIRYLTYDVLETAYEKLKML